MNVIFLDFDGVINCSKNFCIHHCQTTVIVDESKGSILDRKMVKRLKKIVTATNAYIVISSAWRLSHSLNELKCFLLDAGWSYENDERTLNEIIIDKTPCLDGCDNGILLSFRGDEVNMWLQRYRNPVNFICLDDNDDFYSYQNLIKTNRKVGLTDEHVEEAIYRLNKNIKNI